MPSDQRPSPSSPTSSSKGAKDSSVEGETPTTSVQTETRLSTPQTAASAVFTTLHPFWPEGVDGETDCPVIDPSSVLSLFHYECKANDITQEASIRAMPAAIKAAKDESVALADLGGQSRNTQIAVKQAVVEAARPFAELDQLREVVLRLAGEFSQIQERARAAEERSAATAVSDSVILADLRCQLEQTEMAVKQAVDDASACKTEVNQLRETAVRLTGEYSRIEERARAAEERSAATSMSESGALADLRGQLRQTEMAIKQAVDDGGAFRAELEQLREVAVRVTGEYSRAEERARAAEERDAATSMSESMALADLRGQFRQTEMAVKQVGDEAGGFKAELHDLLEVAARLTGEYRRIEKATHAAEKRSAATAAKGTLESVSLHAQLRETEMAVKQSVEEASAFKAELDRLRDIAMRLTQQFNQIEERARTADERSAAILKIVNALETEIGRPAVTGTDTPLAALHVAAERVPRKAEAPKSQSGIDYALVWAQKQPRLSKYLRGVIGGLAVLVLATLMTRSLRDTGQIGRQPVVAPEQPVLATSALVVPAMMVNPGLPMLPQTILPTQATPAQPPPKAQAFAKAQPPDEQTGGMRSAPAGATSSGSPIHYGAISVESQPTGAQVSIDGQLVGVTPLVGWKLPARSHVVRIDLVGYGRWSASIRVVAEKTTRVVTNLEPTR